MAITYEDALATLQSMFAEPWNRDNLDFVLRNQKGHMENTVDLILRHGDKDPQVLIDQLEAGIDPSQTAVAADEELARQLSQQQSGRRRPAAPSRATGGKGKPTTLPEDFLRVPGVTGSAGGSSVVDDEALARMLQDQLFSEELSRNREFAHLARGSRRSGTSSATSRNPGTAGINPIQAAGNKINEFASKFAQNRSNSNRNVQQSPNVMDKVAAMGDNAKRRLQLLAAQFNANHAGAGNNTNNTSAAAPASTQEFRGLLDDDDDNDNMELAARKDL